MVSSGTLQRAAIFAERATEEIGQIDDADSLGRAVDELMDSSERWALGLSGSDRVALAESAVVVRSGEVVYRRELDGGVLIVSERPSAAGASKARSAWLVLLGTGAGSGDMSHSLSEYKVREAFVAAIGERVNLVAVRKAFGNVPVEVVSEDIVAAVLAAITFDAFSRQYFQTIMWVEGGRLAIRDVLRKRGLDQDQLLRDGPALVAMAG